MAREIAASLGDSSLAALYCGPGENVIRTAEIVGKVLGVRPKRINEFRNLDQGLWQGLQIDEIKRRNTRLFRQWIEDPATICPPQGETVERAMERIKAAFRPLLRRHRTRRSAWSSASRWRGWSPAICGASPASSSTSAGPAATSNGSRSRRCSCGTAPPDRRSPSAPRPRPAPARPRRRFGGRTRGLPRRTAGRMPEDSTPAADRGDEDSDDGPAGRTLGERLARALRAEDASRTGSGCAATAARRPCSASRSSRTCCVCPECNHHFRVSAVERIDQLLDTDTFEEWFADLQPGDPLGFNDRRPYPERVKAEQAATGLKEAAVVGQGFIQGHPDRLRHHRQQLHHGEHGLGRRREADPGHRGGDPAAAPPGDRLRLGRRGPDARGDLLADADGQGLDGPGPLPRGGRPVSSAS